MISSQLYGPIPANEKTLLVLLSITIVDANGNYAFSKFSNERGDFYRINPKSHIVIRYTPKETPWEKHHQVVITQQNIYQLRIGLRSFYKNFQRDDLYRYDERGKIVEVVYDSRDEVLISLGMSQFIRFTPSTTMDRHNVVYPSVIITINREENQSNLSVEEFEGFYDLFEHIDIYQSGVTLLQTFIGLSKASVDNKIAEEERKKAPTTTNKIYGRSIFGDAEEKDIDKNEFVKAPLPQKTIDTLDDLY